MIITEEEELEQIFAGVFHSFKDLHHVTPIQFVAKLKRRGVVLARKPKRTPS